MNECVRGIVGLATTTSIDGADGKASLAEGTRIEPTPRGVNTAATGKRIEPTPCRFNTGEILAGTANEPASLFAGAWNDAERGSTGMERSSLRGRSGNADVD